MMACAIVRSRTMRRLMKTFCGPARRSLLGQRRDVTHQRHVAAVATDVDEVTPIAVQLIQPVTERRDWRDLQDLAARTGQREADLRIAQRQLCDDARDLGGFGAIRLEKLAPRRQVVEDIGDLDRGAFRHSRFHHGSDRPAVHADLGARGRAACARPKDEMRHRRDAGQRLTAEPERRDAREIVGPANLARRMALDGQPRILRLHPLAIVLDANQLLAAELDGDGDAPRAGIE